MSSPVESPKPHRWSTVTAVTGIVLLFLTLAAVVYAVVYFSPLTTSTAVQPTTRPPGRLHAIFGSAQPGTTEAAVELKWAADHGFNELVNYSAFNVTAEATQSYLDDALKAGVQIDPSLKDLLGPDDTDTDPDNREMHSLYGGTTDQQVEEILKQFGQHPAIRSFYISDERPKSLVDIEVWLPQLKLRYQQAHQLAPGKPALCSFVGGSSDLSADRLEFLTAVKPYCDEIWLSYYPVGYDGDEAMAMVKTYSNELRQVMGDRGRLIIQGFAWKVEPETAEGIGVRQLNRAPTAKDMVRIHELTGNRDTAFFSYDYAMATSRDQLGRIAEAVEEIGS